MPNFLIFYTQKFYFLLIIYFISFLKGDVMVIARIKSLWQQYQEQKEEKELIQIIKDKTTKAFHSAQLFLVQKDKFTDSKVHIYPEIRSIKLMDYAEIVFTIPKGMNPEDVARKEYVFKQYLSDRAELETGTLKFVIRIFPNELQTVLYNYDAFPLKNEKIPVVCGISRYNKYVIYDMVNTHMY